MNLKLSNDTKDSPTVCIALRWPWWSNPRRIPMILALVLLFLSPIRSSADNSSVSVDVIKPNGWIGERIPILVELRTKGTFAGATSFDLPEVPGALLLKIGNPVISSRAIDGENFFVQTHEFALFSQRVGQVEIPSFPVRFATRTGFTGPIVDEQSNVPAVRVDVKRPPGTEGLGYLVTTEELILVEEWSYNPESTKVGDAIRRSITQRANAIPAMALSPLPDRAPEGIRVYVSPPEISDRMERGAFEGRRKDVLTYLIQKPGEYTLPAVAFYWWNPTTQRLESKTFPALTLQVPIPDNTVVAEVGTTNHYPSIAIPFLLTIFAILVWKRILISQCFHHVKSLFHSTERTLYQKLIMACRQHDAQTAYTTWCQLYRLGKADLANSEKIQVAIAELEQYLYGAVEHQWRGLKLELALRQSRKRFPVVHRQHQHTRKYQVPPLNP